MGRGGQNLKHTKAALFCNQNNPYLFLMSGEAPRFDACVAYVYARCSFFGLRLRCAFGGAGAHIPYIRRAGTFFLFYARQEIPIRTYSPRTYYTSSLTNN